METDMKLLKQETERSRRRIQELEAELERARIMAHKAEREADEERERRVEVEDKVEGLRDERDGTSPRYSFLSNGTDYVCAL